MLKIEDYLQHADECRRLAANAAQSHIRDELLKMVGAWEELAAQRRAMLEHRELEIDIDWRGHVGEEAGEAQGHPSTGVACGHRASDFTSE
jgi:hypothetical protein